MPDLHTEHNSPAIRAEVETALVWQRCEAGGGFATRFAFPEFEGYLPFFLRGDQVRMLNAREPVELRETELLLGLLVTIPRTEEDGHWQPSLTPEIRVRILERLCRGFRRPRIEQLVLDVAQMMHKSVGPPYGICVLESGLVLEPDSSWIRSDLVLLLWQDMAERGRDERSLGRIVDLVREIDLEAVLSGARQAACYYGLCALAMLGRQSELESYIVQYVEPNVTHGDLERRISAVLADPGRFTPADLIVH